MQLYKNANEDEKFRILHSEIQRAIRHASGIIICSFVFWDISIIDSIISWLYRNIRISLYSWLCFISNNRLSLFRVCNYLFFSDNTRLKKLMREISLKMKNDDIYFLFISVDFWTFGSGPRMKLFASFINTLLHLIKKKKYITYPKIICR